jgi:hypothetical protein
VRFLRWVLVPLSAGLALLLAGIGPASAAVTSPGSQAFAAGSAWLLPPPSCAALPCANAGGRTDYRISPPLGTTTVTARTFFRSTDPRTITGWPNLTYSQLGAGSTVVGDQASNVPVDAAGFAALGYTTAGYSGVRWLTVVSGSCVSGGPACPVVALLDIQSTAANVDTSGSIAGAPAPPTTAPPTTSAPATTSAPSSTSAPATPTGTTAPPSTSEPTGTTGDGSSVDCTEAEPCFVKVVDGVAVNVDSIEVSALTDEQWSEIRLGLASLVFFGAMGTVQAWRHGRSS